jgi:beta-glucosidase
MDALLNRSCLDALLRGTSPFADGSFGFPGSILTSLAQASVARPGDAATIARLDLLGLNYYSRSVVRHDPSTPVIRAADMVVEGSERSEMWEIYPAGLGELLDRVWKEYRPSCEIHLTENGVPVPETPEASGLVHDQARIDYLRRHLEVLEAAIGRGVPVRSYFVWSLTDNFEWALGYGPRFGLVRVDYPSQARSPKDSFRFYRDFIAGARAAGT